MEKNLEVVKIEGVRGYVDEKQMVWLNAEDVARGLGFTKTEGKFSTTSGRKIYETVRWARVNQYLTEFDYPDEVDKGDFIPENMFYRLAMKASNEAAKVFQAKVADEILPSIRKHGFYATQDKIEEIVRNPDLFIEQLMTAYKRVKGERDEALAQVAELKPKADYTDNVLKSDEKLTSELIAKEYGHNAQWLHQILKTAGKLYNRGRHWFLKAPFDKCGYRVSETTTLAHGKTVVNHYWTQSGRHFVYNVLAAVGYYPLGEEPLKALI